jgi:hypothetical protein
VTSVVYVVARGERGEGHDPERIFDNLAGALEWSEQAYQLKPQPVGGAWMAVSDNEVDEIWVYRMKVWTA